jgi:hypothetical protein
MVFSGGIKKLSLFFDIYQLTKRPDGRDLARIFIIFLPAPSRHHQALPMCTNNVRNAVKEFTASAARHPAVFFPIPLLARDLQFSRPPVREADIIMRRNLC